MPPPAITITADLPETVVQGNEVLLYQLVMNLAETPPDRSLVFPARWACGSAPLTNPHQTTPGTTF